MKNLSTTIVMIVVMFLLASCEKIDFNLLQITPDVPQVGPYSVIISGTYSFPGTDINKMDVYVSEDGSSEKVKYEVIPSGQEFSVEITGLKPSTTYIYSYLVYYGKSESGFYPDTFSFTTQSITMIDEVPLVQIVEILAIDSVTCRVKCEVVDDGGSPLVERGIYWNTSGDPGVDDFTIQSDSTGLGVYTVYMEHLSLGRQYYVRAYAKNTNGVGMCSVASFKMEALPGMPVNIQVSCSPDEGGTATGGGTYEAGTTCTVEAMAAAGYHFVNWTENGNQVWGEERYTFPVTVERNLVANFSAEAYIISVGIEPEEGGTASGAGGYNHGDTCTLVASPAMGYEFLKWTRNGNVVSAENEYSFVVTESVTYLAHFQAKSYTISVTANPEEGGSVSGGGTFNYGASCTVHAAPAEGYAFERWTDEGDEVSRDENYEFIVTSNRDLVAHFTTLQPDEYSISVSTNPSEGGSVTGGGVYQQGQSCTVRATANTNFEFDKWTENGEKVSEDEEYTFNVTSNRTLVANFTEQTPSNYIITLEANPEEGGTVTGGGTYQQGDQCNVTATAAEGCTFMAWTEGSDTLTHNTTYSFLVTRDRTLVAHFRQIEQYTITAYADPINCGSVAGGGTYQQGQSCTLTAMANTGYSFDHWTRNGSIIPGDASITFDVTENAAYVAHFTLLSYTISTSVIPSGAGNVTGGGTYNYGQNCTLTATPATGYSFVRWTKNGANVSTNNPYSFTVTESATYVARFQAQTYTISASANPTNGGTVTGGGTYNYGQSCTLTATANTGYVFDKWTENGQVIPGVGSSYNFTVTGNRTLVAHFNFALPVVTITSVTNITQTSATVGGNVVSDGGFTVTDKGVVYSSTHNTPLPTDVHVSGGSGTGPFSVNLSGLTPYSQYYVRTYATNSSGTSYSNDVMSFKSCYSQEIIVGNGTSTTTYFPFHTMYKYTLGTCLYRLSELQEGGMTTSPLTSVSFYATTNGNGSTQSGISIWMANVSDDVISSTSPLVSNMTLVYTGNCTPVVGWNDFVFNQNGFSWDGHSNIIIVCQRNHYDWGSSISWQSHSAEFTGMGYAYNDNTPYNALTTTYQLYTSTSRPNIIFNRVTR